LKERVEENEIEGKQEEPDYGAEYSQKTDHAKILEKERLS